LESVKENKEIIMGKCRYCNLDLGWFQGSCCDRCSKDNLSYNISVKIIRGFYKGHTGKLIKIICKRDSIEYEVKFKNGEKAIIGLYQLVSLQLYKQLIKEKLLVEGV